MTDEEKFFAWLDGELDPDDAARVEARIAADPQLQALAAQHGKLAADLRGVFDPIAEDPVPERLARAVHPGQLIGFPPPRAARRFRVVPQWGALAATLVFGIVLGVTMDDGRGGAPVQIRDGRAYAAAGVDQALTRQLASAGEHGDVRVGLTFRNQKGAICRTFTAAASSGLVCRDSQGWRLRGLLAAPEGQEGEFRMAAGTDPAFADLIDSTIAGDPFDAEQEAEAKDNGWR